MKRKQSGRQGEATKPRTFLFRCPTCGDYSVSEKTLRTFLSPKLKRGLTEELKQGAHSVRLDFSPCCPNCDSDGDATVTLVVLRPRLN